MNRSTIIYIWIEKYGCFENTEFNFSEKHNIHFNIESKELVYSGDSKEKYVENFFGDNIDLTAIVGMNGAGKTTLLHLIMSLNAGKFSPLNGIFAFENSYGIEVYSNFESLKISYLDKSKLKIKCYNLKEKSDEKKCLNKMRFIYVTNHFADYYNYCGWNNYYDLSTSGLIRKSKTDVNDNYKLYKEFQPDYLVQYFHNEFKRQIDFFCNYREKIKEFGINYPRYVTASFNFYDSTIFEEWFKSNKRYIEKNNIDPIKIFKNFLPDIKENEINKKEQFKVLLAKAIFSTIIKNLDTVVPRWTATLKNYFIEELLSYQSNQNAWNNLKKFLVDHMLPDESPNNSLIHSTDKMMYWIYNANRYIDFMDYFDNKVELTEDAFNRINTLFDDRRFTISVDSKPQKIKTDIKTSIDDFFSKYKKTVTFDDYLSFEWNLSSGETILLSTFSRLLSITKPKNDVERILPINQNSDEPTENTIIMFDEAEVALHPKWQQKYLKSMLSFLTTVFKETHLQIIIATHSPIILSDIPRQNVMYLSTNGSGKSIVDSYTDHVETFGANIFRLYNDSFFLKEGAMGKFAEKKLEELIKLINEKPLEHFEEIQKRIEMIGDEFLKVKINARFIEKLDVDTKIQKLKAEIKKLELKKSRGIQYDKNS